MEPIDFWINELFKVLAKILNPSLNDCYKKGNSVGQNYKTFVGDLGTSLSKRNINCTNLLGVTVYFRLTIDFKKKNSF